MKTIEVSKTDIGETNALLAIDIPTDIDLAAIGGGLNPQPLPPRVEPERLG